MPAIEVPRVVTKEPIKVPDAKKPLLFRLRRGHGAEESDNLTHFYFFDESNGQPAVVTRLTTLHIVEKIPLGDDSPVREVSVSFGTGPVQFKKGVENDGAVATIHFVGETAVVNGRNKSFRKFRHNAAWGKKMRTRHDDEENKTWTTNAVRFATFTDASIPLDSKTRDVEESGISLTQDLRALKGKGWRIEFNPPMNPRRTYFPQKSRIVRKKVISR